MNKIVVLISGRGSNLKAICEQGLSHHIQCVISNKENALGLEIAKKYNIPTAIINHKEYKSREEFDYELAKIIDTYSPQLIVLAGFMRILSEWFINKYTNQIINIHPSILPAFIGAHAQRDAVEYKVKLSGATVHIVTNQLDHGPILVQGIVPVLYNDSEESLSQRILKIEHTIYPFAIRKILNNQLIHNNQEFYLTKSSDDEQYLSEFKNHIFY